MNPGIVFDIKRYAIHDGPGIRTAVFLKGCPLRCWWCHNPEGQERGFELIYRKTRCITCHKCVEACERNALTFTDEGLFVDRTKCDLCGNCVSACPSGALSMVGKLMSTREIIEEVEKDRPFYEESGGGVTFSGGEPFLQARFLDSLLGECRRSGISTAVNTCGFFSSAVLNKTREKVDLFLFDIKLMDDFKHKKFTCVSNKMILRNVEILSRKGSRIIVTFPVIPSVNDDDQNVGRMGEFLNSKPSVEQVTLLSYHRGGVEKYRNLGRTYWLEKTQPPAEGEMKRIKSRLEEYGLRVTIGGG